MVRASQNAQTPKPLELGAQLLCRWRDNEAVKPCEVLERQQNEDTGEWEYCAPAACQIERALRSLLTRGCAQTCTMRE